MPLTVSQMIAKYHPINMVSSTHADHDSHCGICGGAIKAGDACDDMVLTKTFTNQNDLADMSAPYRCVGCASVMADGRFQMQLSSVVITPQAIYPFAKKVDRGFFLINPPEPPFAMVIGVSKQQHVIWRSPINLNNRRFQIQLGDDRVAIRHSFLMEAVSAVKSIHACDIAATIGNKTKIKENASPFTFSDMKSACSGQNEWVTWAKLLRENGIHKEEFNALDELTSDEAWALDFCLSDEIKKPEPISL
ncbi:type IV CRISPR-associated protein Csf1 [Vibrio vulnificus]|uniref:type IV CRISPR-associated protein Csf1 n=1 Tax=Vibrio vulnificus TaxID=672 RepID=UPI003242BA17